MRYLPLAFPFFLLVACPSNPGSNDSGSQGAADAWFPADAGKDGDAAVASDAAQPTDSGVTVEDGGTSRTDGCVSFDAAPPPPDAAGAEQPTDSGVTDGDASRTDGCAYFDAAAPPDAAGAEQPMDSGVTVADGGTSHSDGCVCFDAAPPPPDAAVTPPDAAQPADASASVDASIEAPDASVPDASPVIVDENEPNNGSTETEYEHVTIPVAMRGAVDPADDIELLGFSATAGNRLVVSVNTGGVLQPHLAVFGTQDLNVPAAVSVGTGNVMAEYYVLKGGSYFIALRDQRNVGSSSHVGGPTFTWTLSAQPLVRDPVPAVVGGDTPLTLAPLGTIGVFSFEGQAEQNVSITVLARRLSPPSHVDPRLSLFFPDQQLWLGTNDDMALNQLDSLIEGTLPYTGTYHAIVENEGSAGTDLRVVLRISSP